jgi:hypothetical protein
MGEPTPRQQAHAANATTQTQTLAGAAHASRNAGTCTADSQSGSMERSPETVHHHDSEPFGPRTQSTFTRATERNLNVDAARPQPGEPTNNVNLGRLLQGSSSDSTVLLVTPEDPTRQCQPSTSVACGTGTAAVCNLHTFPSQEQQMAEMQSKAAQIVLLSAKGTMKPLNAAMLQQLHSWSNADAQFQQKTGTQLVQQLQESASQEGIAPSSCKIHKHPDVKRSRTGGTTEVHEQDVCQAAAVQQSCPSAVAPHDHGSSTPTDSLPASTTWAPSPVPDSDNAFKQQDAAHTARCPAVFTRPPRSDVRKIVAAAGTAAAHHAQHSHAQSQSQSVSVRRTPRLSKNSNDRPAFDSSDSHSATDSFQDGYEVQSDASTCPSALNGAPAQRMQRKQKGKAKGASSSGGSLRGKGKAARKRSSIAELLSNDNGRAAGLELAKQINGRLSPLLSNSSTVSMHQSQDWRSRRTPASIGSIQSCPACAEVRVHAHCSASRSENKSHTIHRCVRRTKGSVRQTTSKAGGTSTMHRNDGDCGASTRSKVLGGAQDGKRVVRQAYIVALSAFSARTPSYAKPTKAALLRQACASN